MGRLVTLGRVDSVSFCRCARGLVRRVHWCQLQCARSTRQARRPKPPPPRHPTSPLNLSAPRQLHSSVAPAYTSPSSGLVDPPLSQSRQRSIPYLLYPCLATPPLKSVPPASSLICLCLAGNIPNIKKEEWAAVAGLVGAERG